MSALTLRLSDEKHLRLKNLAAVRGISVNQLLNEAATTMLAQYDAEIHFQTRATRGNPNRGLALLDKALSKQKIQDDE